MSQRASGYERQSRELYETPEWVTETVLGFVDTRPGSIWEPAAGGGKIVRVLTRRFLVLASDIDDGVDFLKSKALPDASIRGIFTNPPYNQSVEFCEHALHLTRPCKGYVAMLLRVDFDSASTRQHLFAGHPAFARKITLTRRIAWFVEANGKPKASPSENHAWFLWDWSNTGPPVISYAPAALENRLIVAGQEAIGAIPPCSTAAKRTRSTPARGSRGSSRSGSPS